MLRERSASLCKLLTSCAMAQLGDGGVSMKLKLILLAIAVAAVLVGFALPTPGSSPRAVSQIATLEVGG